MLVFGVHEGERVAVDVPIGATVGDVKKLIQVGRFSLNFSKMEYLQSVRFSNFAVKTTGG